MTPKRIQRKRTKGWRMPANARRMPYNWTYGSVEQRAFWRESLFILQRFRGLEAASDMLGAEASPPLGHQENQEQRIPAAAAGRGTIARHGGQDGPWQLNEQDRIRQAETRCHARQAIQPPRSIRLRQVRLCRQEGFAFRSHQRRRPEAPEVVAVRKRLLQVVNPDVDGQAACNPAGALCQL